MKKSRLLTLWHWCREPRILRVTGTKVIGFTYLKTVLLASLLITTFVIGGLVWRELTVAFFRPPLTIWTGYKTMEGKVVVDGTNTLIIDGATINNPHRHSIIVEDSATLIIRNGRTSAPKRDGYPDSKLRIYCDENCTVTISESTIDWLTVGTYVGNFTIISSNITVMQLEGDPAVMSRLKIIDCTIERLDAPLTAHGNLTLAQGTIQGDYDIGVEVLGASTIQRQLYDLLIDGSEVVHVADSTIQLACCTLSDSAQLFISNFTHYTGLNRTISGFLGFGLTGYGAIITALDNASVIIAQSSLGQYSALVLRHNASADAYDSTIGRVYADGESRFTGEEIGLDYGINSLGGGEKLVSEFRDHATARMVNSTNHRVLKEGNKIVQNYAGLGRAEFNVYDQAVVVVENVTLAGVYYSSATFTAET